MKKIRKALAYVAVAMLSTMSSLVVAQTWPEKPIKIIVPYTPGGASDITARILADRMSTKFGQAVTVDNRAGARGIGNRVWGSGSYGSAVKHQTLFQSQWRRFAPLQAGLAQQGGRRELGA
jgi:hypothetical protein